MLPHFVQGRLTPECQIQVEMFMRGTVALTSFLEVGQSQGCRIQVAVPRNTTRLQYYLTSLNGYGPAKQ